MSDHLRWIEPERRFTVDGMVFFQGAGEVALADVLHRFDLVITGPHPSAALPRELEPFVDTRFTERLQLDFTDVATSPVARRWAAIDPRVLYIEDPHPRAVRDANRPARAGRPSLAEVDAVRPVTFAYSNAHGPNEYLHLPTARRLTAGLALLLRDHATRASA